MVLKGMDGQEHKVTSQGQGTLNTVLGSLGTASFLGMGANGNGCNGSGLLGNLFGNNCHSCPVDQKELAYAIELASCRGREYALATAREEDAKIFNEARRNDDKIAGVVKEVTQGLIAVGNGVSRLDSKVSCIEERLNWMQKEDERNLREAKNYTDTRVNAEAQLRKAGDENVAAWASKELCRKIDGELTINGDQVCYHGCKPVLQQCPCGTETNPINIKVLADALLKAVKEK